ncbi:hypothetical protein Tco_0612431, partial [Tanacetum coccineum]
MARPYREAIKTRFGGNKESKKMQKTILKQEYENFTASRSEGLDKTYDRFQKLISQLEIHGEVISQEDANLKLIRSLPLAWNNIALIMRNKSDLDTMSMDDLYNNFKVYEAEIKSQSNSSLNSQNVAFVSSENTSNTNEAVNTTYELDNEDLEQIDTDGLEEMDLKWQAEEGPTYFALMAHLSLGSSTSSSLDSKNGIAFDSQMTENKLHDIHKNNSEVFVSASDSSMNEIKEENNQVNDRGTTEDVRLSTHITEEWESDSDDDCVTRPLIKQNKPSYAKINFVKSNENTRKSVIEQNTYRQVENLRKSQSPEVDKEIEFLTKYGNVPINTAKQSFLRAAVSNSIARYVNIAATRPIVNDAKPSLNVFHNGLYTSKRFDYVDPQGRLKHMTRNKSYLTDYQDIDGGFIAFAGSPKGGKITGK